MMTIKKVLILDDDSGHQILVSKLCERSFPCEITLASTLAEAKKKIQQKKFDIITLDGCLFHVEYGYQLIPAIKEIQSQNCVIIMISSSQKSIDDGLSLHADYGFLKEEIVTGEKKVQFNERFEIVPVECDVHNDIWKSVGLSTDFFLTIETISL